MVIANFVKNETYQTVYGLWQWDYGQILRIQGLKLPDGTEIHFSLSETGGNAVPVISTTTDGITETEIPNSLLTGNNARANFSIYAFIYLDDGERGKTIKRIRMYISARPKPADYVYTEDEIMSYKVLEARVKNLEENGVAAGGGIDVNAELKEYYTTAKDNIAAAIVYKGGVVEADDSLNAYADRIRDIPNGVIPTETIPPQTCLTANIRYDPVVVELVWPDVQAAGYRILKKENFAPESTSDGEIIYDGADQTFTDEEVALGQVYYYRIFPYNDKGQFQAEEENSIAKADIVDRAGQKLIGELAVGDVVKFGRYDNQEYTWKVVDTQEKASGWLTFAADQCIERAMYDAPENNADNPNPITARKNQGNNRWLYANIRQLFNSDAAAGEWYTAQHDYDVAPSYATSKNGFMHDLTDYEKSVVLKKTNKCILDMNDGGGSETAEDYFWLPSTYAMGLEVATPLEDAVVYEAFPDNASRAYTSSYWTRTVNNAGPGGTKETASSVRSVGSNGSLFVNVAANNGNYAARPFCLLPTSAYVVWSESDSAYVFADDSQREA